MTDAPKLLKARQSHSRLFAVPVVLLVLISQPWLTAGVFPRECMLWLGYALVIIGALGRVYSSAYIGGRKNDEVINIGPFSVVRNPLYVFSFLAVAGIGLESGMIWLFVLLTGAYIWYYPAVVAKEEAFLEHKFGDAYRAYMQSVPRWIPNLKLWNEPTHIDAQPKFIRKTLLDALVFFLPMPGFAILTALHAHHILPVWITLP
jgi:protein-S-isoprenylcysteine O-methyltransferase Ste14